VSNEPEEELARERLRRKAAGIPQAMEQSYVWCPWNRNLEGILGKLRQLHKRGKETWKREEET
jgi:hypothetical protein